jgi:hypothetical protein
MEVPTFTPVPPGTRMPSRKFKNISYHSANKVNKWRVYIQRNKKMAFSAYYLTEEDAIRGRDAVFSVLEQERKDMALKPTYSIGSAYFP